MCSLRRPFTSPQVPASESLEDCRERLLPFLTDELRPAMAEAVTAIACRPLRAAGRGANTRLNYLVRPYGP